MEKRLKVLYSNTPIKTLLILIFWLSLSTAFAANRTVNLVVAYKTVDFTGKTRRAITVNNQIPGPILHFKQGDHVTLNVYNKLDKGTSIHWHGLLVPWQMDGVEGVTQRPIPPGGVFHYRFTLHQSGTYWYHAHSGVQEQEGLYGALIIDPPRPSRYQYTQDYTVVLSDWSNIPAENILKNLKKDGDYFSPRFPLQPSLKKFLHSYFSANTTQRKKVLADYKMMQKMRMSIYDFSDVAYDAFLMNGQTNTQPWTAKVKLGDTVRLRFIGASASTIFNVKIPGSKLTIIHVDGNDIKPLIVNSFTIAPGETYDVLIHITRSHPYIIYAESSDTLGAAIGALITKPHQVVNYQQVKPFPEPQPITMGHRMNSGIQHGSMKMHNAHQSKPTRHSKMHHPSKRQTKDSLTTGTKYQNIVAAVKTNNPHKPIEKIIRMDLSGWMHSYIWFINGLPEYKVKPILLKPGKRYRLIFTNHSMMKHPMHIHGHWFILRNGHGAYDPLLHTIRVPPNAKVVVDFDTEASGQWFFHCHHLFHMMAGMSRIFQYSTLIDLAKNSTAPQSYVNKGTFINRPIVQQDITMPLDRDLVMHPSAHSQGFYVDNNVDVGVDPFHNIQMFSFRGLYGTDFHKLALQIEDAELSKGEIESADIDIFYWHPIAQFWALKGGANYFYRPAKVPYWQPGIGIEGLTPYFIHIDTRVYFYRGSVKFDVELTRDTQITNNFFIRVEARAIAATKTVNRAEIGSGLNQMQYAIRPYYSVAPGIELFFEYEHEQNHGAFKRIKQNDGEASCENITAFGVNLRL